LSVMEFLTLHYILCHPGNLGRCPLNIICISPVVGLEFDYLITNKLTGGAKGVFPATIAVSGTIARWKESLRAPSFRLQFLPTVPILGILLFSYAHFLDWIEVRPGVVLHDPFLTSLKAHQLTWRIFGLIYGALMLGLGTLSIRPTALLVALQSYALLFSSPFRRRRWMWIASATGSW